MDTPLIPAVYIPVAVQNFGNFGLCFIGIYPQILYTLEFHVAYHTLYIGICYYFGSRMR